MPQAYTPEGYLKKNPLLGSIYSSASNNVLSGLTTNFGKLYEQAVQAGALGRSDYVQTFTPKFEQVKSAVQPDYTQALFKGQQAQGRANLLRGRVMNWYHENFPGRNDFYQMIRKRANRLTDQATPHLEKAAELEQKVAREAKPLNQFFGGEYFDAGLDRPVLQPYRYEVKGRDWKKRKIRGGQEIIGTASGSYYPGAPKKGLF